MVIKVQMVQDNTDVLRYLDPQQVGWLQQLDKKL